MVSYIDNPMFWGNYGINSYCQKYYRIRLLVVFMMIMVILVLIVSWISFVLDSIDLECIPIFAIDYKIVYLVLGGSLPSIRELLQWLVLILPSPWSWCA